MGIQQTIAAVAFINHPSTGQLKETRNSPEKKLKTCKSDDCGLRKTQAVAECMRSAMKVPRV
jgi:hypothetical protein